MSEQANTIGDENVARLVARAGEPVAPDPAFMARVTERLRAEARARRAEAQTQAASWRSLLAAGLSGAVLSAALLTSAVLLSAPSTPRPEAPAPTPRVAPLAEPAAPDDAPTVVPPPAVAPPPEVAPTVVPPDVAPPDEEPGVTAQAEPLGPPAPASPPTPTELLADLGQVQPRPRLAPVPSPRASVGQTIATGPRERRRLALDDGSTLDVDAATRVVLLGERRLRLEAGRLHVDVAPRVPDDPLVVETPGGRTLTALGTRFAVSAGAAPELLVAHGVVGVTGPCFPPNSRVRAGTRADLATGNTAPLGPTSRALSWTRDLAVAAESPLVAGATGPALLVRDATGQEASLPLRRTTVDVVVEDGFARTAIDLTFFNRTWSRLEGTFRLPLPAGASISRLAMYCEGKLMEGACVERERARTVFETIRHEQRPRDPALLEWLDGGVFKLRVFPLEARQEKRVVLCYTQRLEGTSYRLLGGGPARPDRFSFRARVRGGAQRAWGSRTHELAARQDGADLVLEHLSLDASALAGTAGDLVLDLGPEAASTSLVGGAGVADVVDVGGWRYLAVRARCDLPVAPRPERRAWVVAVETSGDRDPLLARTALDAARGLLAQAGPDDLFALLSASTRTTLVSSLGPVTPAAVEAALARLEGAHLVGALDLGAELAACAGPLAAARVAGAEPWLVQLGTALPVLGERDPDALLARLPEGARVLGIGVGRRWNQPWLKRAAARTGGHVAQLFPDEPVAWRASEIASALDAPRLLDVRVEGEGVQLLVDREALLEGDELLALARLKPGQAPPREVVVTGSSGGAAVRWVVRLGVPRVGASHLARTWGRLEVERQMTGADPEAARREVVALGTSLNLITPFTSLLVLENEAMHREFHVPMGTREHWAPYDLPPSLPIVSEGGTSAPPPGTRRPRAEVLASFLRPRAGANVPFLASTPIIGGLLVGDLVGSSFDFDTGFEREAARDASRLPKEQTLFGSSMFGGRTENILNGGNAYFGGDRLSTAAPAEEGTTSNIYQRSMRRLEATDYFYRTREVPLGDDGNPDYEDDDDDDDAPKVVGFDRSTFGEGSPFAESPIAAGESLAGGGRPRAMRVDIDFEGEDLANAMEAIGREVGRNILVDPNVRETIRVSLRDIPWRDALDVIASMTGLQVEERTGGIVVLTRPPRVPRGRAERGGLSFECYLAALQGGDLLPLAPGLCTSAEDVQAVLDAEALENEVTAGRADDGARRLLDRARRASWERVELAGGAVVRHEGAGRFVLERRLEARLGLVERVASDGVRLTHQYPELGLASTRQQGPAYRELLRSVVPWAVPAPDELTRGADLLLTDGATVRLVPRDARLAVEELVFADERLVERRLLDRDGGVLVRERYVRSARAVEVVRQEGMAAPSTRTLFAEPCPAPPLQELQPSSDLVVLPLPWRRVASTQSPDLTADPVVQAGDAFARDDHTRVLKLAQQLLERGDRRRGWYALLAANPRWYLSSQEARLLLEGPMWTHHVGRHGERAIDRLGPTVDAPVAWFAARQSALDAVGGVPPAELPGAVPGSFFGRLALLRRAAALREGRDAWLDRAGALGALERLVEDTALRPFAAGLIAPLVGSRHPGGVDERLDAALVRCVGDDQPAEVALGARRSRLNLAQTLGDATATQTRAVELVRASAERGRAPTLSEALHVALGEEARVLVDAARALVRADRRREAERLAGRLDRLGADALAVEVRAVSREGASLDALRELELLEALGADDEHLVELLGRASAAPDRPEQAELLKRVAAAAGRQGRVTRAAAFAERALALEDASQDELVDVSLLRARTGQLLGWLRQQVEAHRRLDQPIPADLAPRIVRAVDRLRAVDAAGAVQVCREAAHLLGEVNEPTLAWDYQVTPVALAPDEAPRWADLAEALAVQGQHAQADEAMAQACAVEPTDADLLLVRARRLLARGEATRARPLLEQLTRGPWQPRFSPVQSTARQLLDGLR